MTVVPLPDVPCVRCALDYTQSDGFKGGSRFYLSYDGSAPTGANATTLATDIANAYVTNLRDLVAPDWSLTEVDVLDIATNRGLSGQWTGDVGGSASGSPMPSQCSVNIEYGIARRYRGGKPRMFLPSTVTANQLDGSRYSAAFLTAVNSGVAAFFAELAALSIGSIGTLAHVNLSYYEGFHNITNSSGRERAVPTYRPTALHDTVTGYFCKAVIGTQKRRRSATTY